MSVSIKILSPAKINLYLDVGAKRADGFHEVYTVLQTIDLYDELSLERTDGEISLRCDHPDLPSDSSNLCLRAAEAVRRFVSRDKGVAIALLKRIPVAAGLGGGSSDAAAVLKGLNELWGIGLSTEELRGIAAEIGSDVPFFIEGGTAVCTGRGEKVYPLKTPPSFAYTLIVPPIAVSTESVYGDLDESGGAVGERGDGFLNILRSGDVFRVASGLYNRLEESGASPLDEVRRIKNILMELGALRACMSGSGPSVFGICKSTGDAGRIASDIRGRIGRGYFVHHGRTSVGGIIADRIITEGGR